MSKAGKLYLLPVPITQAGDNNHIPAYNLHLIQSLKKFIAEDAKTARAFLKGFGYNDIQEADIVELNKHTKEQEVYQLLTELLNGHNVGVMSESGCPAIADPGAEIIKLAHKKGIEVIPLSGPSAIVLGIMASGFNGQNFAFVGYLPLDKDQKVKRIKELEQLAHKYKQAQFFIETPYRNEQMFETLINRLLPQSLLFVGVDIGSPRQLIKSKAVTEWRKTGAPRFHKIPTVFGIYTD